MYFVKVLSKKILQPTGSSSDTLFKLTMAYDGSGRRISKTSMRKVTGAADWDTTQVTHYTGIGTEIRENYAGPAKETKVVVNMPNGLGRYGIEDAGSTDNGSVAGNIPNAKFEWYLKNHLGSTMLVYGTQSDANPAHSDIGTPLAAYDYRAFGEMLELLPPPTGKVTENFTGKEHDDEIALDYFGARYLDPMLGMWVSVDPKRQFASPYLYAGNGVNPVNGTDPDGKGWILNTYLYGGEIYIKGDLKYVNDGSNDIHFKLPGGFETRFASPPIGSYFFSVNLNDVKFDPNMIHYIRKMRNEIKESETPVIDYLKWRSGGNFDFKDRFYGDKVYTIGILDGTIMTARDVGNTLWGERMKERNWSWTMTNFISDLISEKLLVIFGCQEDYESKKMQDWGYHKRK